MKHTCCSMLLFLSSAANAHAGVYSWQGSSGLFPNKVNSAMALVNTSSPEVPTLTSGILTLRNNSASEFMYYSQSSDLTVPAMPEVTFSMRFVSGGSNATRSNAAIWLNLGSNRGVILFIAQDEVFAITGSNTRAAAANVDTDGAIHDYRLSLSGSTVGSSYTLFQNDVPLFTSVVTTGGQFTAQPNVAFGDGTLSFAGETQWTAFSHNLLVPSPGVASVLGLGGLIAARRRR